MATNMKKKSLWKQIHTTEQACQTARVVWSALSDPHPSGGLCMVIGPLPTGASQQQFSSKGELELACIDKAGRHFTQANSTPFLAEPLLTLFGETGCNSQVFQQVLDGTFHPPMACNPYTAKLLCHLQYPPNLQQISPHSLQEYQSSWQKAWEAMSSSPSGVHFGHYIVGTFNPDLLILNARLADIPLSTGYSTTRWHKGLNVMLKKSPGNFNVEKLWIILLFKADFNLNNKWLGQAVMFWVEQAHLLAPEQYGSWKYKLAIVQCLNKLFFYDFLQFHHQAAALCLNDAKSCYNHIMLLIAALCLCQLGTSKPAIVSMINTLHDMEHHIQTSFSDLAKSGSQKNGMLR